MKSGTWPASERAILHVDMDAFFASVELLRHPELRGRPVVVGGAGDRGVVAAASYEARAYGIHSAMPSVVAKRLCPDAVFLRGDHPHYASVSSRVMELMREVTPLVEPISLDEAFLDVTSVRRLWGEPSEMAASLRARIRDRERLDCSVGVATCKFIAKLASEQAKPRATLSGTEPGTGVLVVWPGEELQFLHPLPVERLWGVGPVTHAKLRRLGVETVGELAALPLAALESALGAASGRHLHALAHARDERPVTPSREARSIGHEETFASDHHSHETLGPELVRLADSVGSRLRTSGRRARTIVLKVRFGDRHTITRSVTVADPTDSGTRIAREAGALLAEIDPSPGVRLLGVSVSGLTVAGARQLSFDEPESVWEDANRAVDEIRARFGRSAIGPAALAAPGSGIAPAPGSQPWGPEDRPIPGGGGSSSWLHASAVVGAPDS